MNRIKAWGWAFVVSMGVLALMPQAVSAKTTTTKLVVPKSISATYVVTKNGAPFANVHEQFTATKNTYQVESVTKGLGVYALLGERKLTSTGEITAQGLKPNHFELHQGNQKKKSLLTNFDWVSKTLVMTIKGEQETEQLKPGTQDLASYPYQFMFMRASLKNTITVPVTTGKKLKQYSYKVSSDIKTIDSAGVQYKTLYLTPSHHEGKETKDLWLATEQNYLPVRIVMVDEDGQKLEQTLTELRIKN